jgi:hypothetical protein
MYHNHLDEKIYTEVTKGKVLCQKSHKGHTASECHGTHTLV